MKQKVALFQTKHECSSLSKKQNKTPQKNGTAKTTLQIIVVLFNLLIKCEMLSENLYLIL